MHLVVVGQWCRDQRSCIALCSFFDLLQGVREGLFLSLSGLFTVTVIECKSVCCWDLILYKYFNIFPSVKSSVCDASVTSTCLLTRSVGFHYSNLFSKEENVCHWLQHVAFDLSTQYNLVKLIASSSSCSCCWMISNRMTSLSLTSLSFLLALLPLAMSALHLGYWWCLALFGF